MRSKKPDLGRVVAEFEGWRAKPHGRLIPEKLWRGALELLDGYSSSTICRHLRLNPARFKQIREAQGVSRDERRARRRRGRGGVLGRALGAGLRLRTAPHQVRLAPSGNAFVELRPLSVGVGGGIVAPAVGEKPRATAGCRLILESAAGTLTVVTARPDPGLVEAVCRFVLGALGDGSEA
jgi:hypothetical protein